jgi:hypothetical protein
MRRQKEIFVKQINTSGKRIIDKYFRHLHIDKDEQSISEVPFHLNDMHANQIKRIDNHNQ